MSDLGIITGVGALSQEIIALADRLPGGYSRFELMPWLPLNSAYAQFVGKKRGVVVLHPFDLTTVREEFSKSGVRNLLLIGDFPKTRFLQVYSGRRVWKLARFTDKLFLDYFDATDDRFSAGIRYFHVLSRFFGDLGIKPVLAGDVFPQLKV